MLNELTGLLDYSKVRDYQVSMNAMRSKNLLKVEGVDTFVRDNENEDLRRFSREQETLNMRKVYNKKEPVNFESYLKRALEKISKR